MDFVPPTNPDARSFPFVLTASSAEALESLRLATISKLESTPEAELPDLKDLCYTSLVTPPKPHVLSFTPHDIPTLLNQLKAISATNLPVKPPPFVDPPSVFNGIPATTLRTEAETKLMIFGGQGSQYLGMGKALLNTAAVFTRCVYECDHALREAGYRSIMPIFERVEVTGLNEEDTIIYNQCAIYTIELALALQWEDWGFRPDAVIGHSLGEYAALAFSGAMTQTEGLLLVANRARLMFKHLPLKTSGLAAVFLPESVVLMAQKMLAPAFDGIELACQNSPVMSIVGGEWGLVKAFTSVLKDKFQCPQVLELDLPFAFHTSHLDPLLPHLTKYAEENVVLKKPKYAVCSNADGRILDPENSLDHGYFSRQARGRVRFVDEIQHLKSVGMMQHTVGVEVSAWPVSLYMFVFTVASDPEVKFEAVPSLVREMGAWEGVAAALGNLYGRGVGVDYRKVFAEVYAKRVSGWWVGEEEAAVMQSKDVKGGPVTTTAEEVIV